MMTRINKLFRKRFAYARRKQWDKVYVLVDIHDTIIEANYDKEIIPTKFYDLAESCLQKMSESPDFCLILWTCSHINEIDKYINFFATKNIKFDYVNKNPEVKTQENGYGCYDSKMFADIILDDKAGFDPETDWPAIRQFLDDYVPLNTKFDGKSNVLINSTHLIRGYRLFSHKKENVLMAIAGQDFELGNNADI